MSFPECVPQLTDGVVRLRAHQPSDAQRISEQANDPTSMRWTAVPAPYGEAQAREFLAEIAAGWDESGGNRLWAIVAAADPDGHFQGTIDIRPRGGGLATVGYGLHPQGRGRHLMSGAMRLVADWWFQDQGGTRLTWCAFADNLSSWAVARSAGFRFDGVLRQVAALRTGEIVDEWIGSLDVGDPLEPRAPWYHPPVAERDGVRLRPWRAEDADAVEPPDHPSHHVPEGAVATPDNFEEWLRRRHRVMATGTSVNWCIAQSATDRALGELLVFAQEGTLAESDTAELGYALFPTARGRGVTLIAARLGVTHAFTPVDDGGLGLRRLTAETAADNVASNRILQQLGFTVWGREEAATAPDGSVGPAMHWELRNPAYARDPRSQGHGRQAEPPSEQVQFGL